KNRSFHLYNTMSHLPLVNADSIRRNWLPRLWKLSKNTATTWLGRYFKLLDKLRAAAASVLYRILYTTHGCLSQTTRTNLPCISDS
ncbi:hypothetical protein RYX36_008386, partial [Vicia faba]